MPNCPDQWALRVTVRYAYIVKSDTSSSVLCFLDGGHNDGNVTGGLLVIC